MQKTRNETIRPSAAPILALSLAIAGMAPSAALAQQPPARPVTGPADAAQEIGAQVNVTRDAVDQMLRAIQRRGNDSTFKAADYWEQLPEFRRRIESGMDEFQGTLRDSVLKKLGFWMERYNQVFLSKQFSDEQKKVLLAQVRVQLDAQLKLITAEYYEAIRRAFALAGELPYSLELEEVRGKSSKEIRKLGERIGCPREIGGSRIAKVGALALVPLTPATPVSLGPVACGYGRSYLPQDVPRWKVPNTDKAEGYFAESLERYSPGAQVWGPLAEKAWNFSKLTAPVYYERVFPGIAGTCRSQICLGLRAGDVAFFLGLVKSSIDRAIVMKLADQTEIRMPALDLKITLASWFLARVDYPAQYQALPFDTP